MPMDLRTLNSETLQYSFDRRDLPNPPSETAIPLRDLFYFLVNIDEHPEILPLARDLVKQELHDDKSEDSGDLAHRITGSSIAERVVSLADALSALRSNHSRALQTADADVARRRLLHVLTQYLPVA